MLGNVKLKLKTSSTPIKKDNDKKNTVENPPEEPITPKPIPKKEESKPIKPIESKPIVEEKPVPKKSSFLDQFRKPEESSKETTDDLFEPEFEINESEEEKLYNDYQTKAIVPIIQQDMTTLNNSDVVKLLTSPSKALTHLKLFHMLKKMIILKSDLQKIGDKHFPKKKAFRKYAQFFGLSDEILEAKRFPPEHGKTLIRKNPEGNSEEYYLWEVTTRAIAPNGRYATGTAIVESIEWNETRNINKYPSGYVAKHWLREHDVKSTAHTRAKNRAIGDLVAEGEVSADEMPYVD